MEIPKSFREPSPGSLEIRSGGGCMTIFGIPFLAAGCFVLLIGLGLLPLHNASEVPPWGWPVMILMGLVFVGAGSAMVFGRGAIRIDVTRGTVNRQWSLVVPIKNEETLLAEFSDVVIEFTPGDSDSSERFPVRLWSSSTGKHIELTSPTEYPAAFREAQFLAKFLRLPLRDRSGDQEILLSDEDLARSIRERVPPAFSTAERIARPTSMRSEVDESGTSLRISITGPSFRPSIAIRVALPLVIFLLVVFEFLPFFRRTNTPEGVQWVFLGFFALFMLLPVLGAIGATIRAFRAKTVVTVSGSGIILEETGTWRTRSTTVPADSILAITYGTRGSALDAASRSVREKTDELRAMGGTTQPATVLPPRWLKFITQLVPSKGVIIKSTVGVFSFGQGLPDEEVRYLHWIVTQRLSAQHA